MGRASVEDWLDHGLQLLSERGVQALTLEKLCRSIQKTKGSFYHHFKDMNAYIGRLLERWRERQTQIAIDIAETKEDPRERLELLDQTVRDLDHRLDQIIRFWARSDERAAIALEEVDGMRVGYLQRLLLAAGVGEVKAKMMAELEYTAFLGAQQRFPNMRTSAALQQSETLRAALELWGKREESAKE